jgi:hypothetical protein
MRRRISRKGVACGVALLVVLVLVCGAPALASHESPGARVASDGGVCCFAYEAHFSGEMSMDFGPPYETVAGQANVDAYRGVHSAYWEWSTKAIGRYTGTTRTGDFDMEAASEVEQISEKNKVADFDSNGDTWVPETCRPANVNRPDHKVDSGWAENVGRTKVNPWAFITEQDPTVYAQCLGNPFNGTRFFGPFEGDPRGSYNVPAPPAKWFFSAHGGHQYSIEMKCAVTFTNHSSIGQDFKGARSVDVDITYFPAYKYDVWKDDEIYSDLGHVYPITLDGPEQQVADNPSGPFENPPKTSCSGWTDGK